MTSPIPRIQRDMWLEVDARPQYLAIRSDAFGPADWREAGGGPVIGIAELAHQQEGAGQEGSGQEGSGQEAKKVRVWLEPARADKTIKETGKNEEGTRGNKELETENQAENQARGWASPSLDRLFNGDWYARSYRVTSQDPITRKVMSGHSEYINIANRVQVTQADKANLGDMALLIAPGLSGPVRVEENLRVHPGTVRLFYATRVLWGLEKDMQLDLDEEQGTKDKSEPADKGNDSQAVWLQPLGPDMARKSPERRGAEAGRFARGILEFCIGAPAVPLRATEALVGDEARAVARVDSTVLDFLGVQAGDRVIVSWGQREASVRVLLQTDGQRKQMLKQFSGPTGPKGKAKKEATGGTAEAGTMASSPRTTRPADPDRTFPPWHLQVWLSPEIRRELGIPADTIVTIRRSVAHFAMKNLIALEIPVAGLIIAAFAIPQVLRSWWIIPVFLLVMLVLAFIPLRLPWRPAGAGKQTE